MDKEQPNSIEWSRTIHNDLEKVGGPIYRFGFNTFPLLNPLNKAKKIKKRHLSPT